MAESRELQAGSSGTGGGKKKLYLIGGPMGVGKTAVSRCLKETLDNSVFLDGDWCWDASPFQVTEETKAMVLDNICHVLNNFLDCPVYENVIFCWVMHRQDILDTILGRLHREKCRVVCVSLLCEEKILARRLSRDIRNGLRIKEIIERSLSYLPLYAELATEKIDVSDIPPEEAAMRIANLGKEQVHCGKKDCPESNAG